MESPHITDEEDDDAAAMAASMGFSSFGTQKPVHKKRKFNPTTDAFVDGQELASLDKGGKQGQGSGGNTMPLGKTRVFGSGSRATYVKATSPGKEIRNQGEIELDDEEIEGQAGDEEDGLPMYTATTFTGPVEGREDDGPNYVNTSQPPPALASDEEAREIQARVDAIISGEDATKPASELQYDVSNMKSQAHGLPQRPSLRGTAFATGGSNQLSNAEQFMTRGSRQSYSDTASVASSSRPSQRGQRNELWYIGYYDPSFNENPWAKLETAIGLTAASTHLENE